MADERRCGYVLCASDLRSGQRAALAAVWLRAGRDFTPDELGAELGVSAAQVRLILAQLSEVLPIVRDEDRRWRWLE